MSLERLKRKVARLIEKAQNAGGGGGNTDELEAIIDNSGVLDSTDGTLTEKIEQLTHYVDCFKQTYKLSYYSVQSIEHIDFYIDFITYEVNFQYCRSLKTIVGVDVTKLNTCRNMFFNCSSLVSIQRPFDMSKHNAYHMNNMFVGCASLVDVRFVVGTIKENISFGNSPLLSAESIQSIIDGLATVETAQTLTLHADVKAKLTDEQLATITSKNWSVA